MGDERPVYRVIVSSSWNDLEDLRKKIIEWMPKSDLLPVAMEGDPSSPLFDKIDASLDKVERADGYLGLIGYRYGGREACAERNPYGVSLTELEYERAVERGIPRASLIMGDEYPVPKGASAAETDDNKAALAKFAERCRARRICQTFNNDDEFAEFALKTLNKLYDAIAQRKGDAPTPTTGASTEKPPLKAPPAFDYVRKAYAPNRTFQGRVDELAKIDAWATSEDTMLLFQAIGGMGKSMLTWRWINTRAASVRSDWAGRLWYSFYEDGASLKDFLVHANAYIAHQPLDAFEKRSTPELAKQLRDALDEKPWLLVMDGLERILVAYNTVGAESQSDEEAASGQDPLGLDRETRACFRPDDDDALLMLAQAARGKLLASTRLVPKALTDGSGGEIPGVDKIALAGLRPEDAESLLRDKNIRGDGDAMRRYLRDKFDCHPLSVGAVAGLIADGRLDWLGDFDAWERHPNGGADPRLVADELRSRQNHILDIAFEALSSDDRELMTCLAITPIELTLETVRILNPKRPAEDSELNPPARKSNFDLYDSTNDTEIEAAFDAWIAAPTGSEEEAAAQARLDPFLDADLVERTAAFEADTELRARRAAWRAKAAQADEWLDLALKRLENLGLLQVEGGADGVKIDMHPAVRHSALRGLDGDAMARAGGVVSDALASQPQSPMESARTLKDLELPLNQVRALAAAGQLEQAWDAFRGPLAEALYRLGESHERLALVQIWFTEGFDGPIALPEHQHALALNIAALALKAAGDATTALPLEERGLGLYVARSLTLHVTIAAANLSRSLVDDRRRAAGLALLALSERLTRRRGVDAIKVIHPAQMASAFLRLGDLDLARDWLERAQAATPSGYQADLAIAVREGVSLELAWRDGSLTTKAADAALSAIRATGDRPSQATALVHTARWRQDRDEHGEAIAAYNEAIGIGRETRWRNLPLVLAERALSQARLGQTDEAARAAAEAETAKKPPHLALAKLYHALDRRDDALTHAREAYIEAWGEGSPFARRFDLQDARAVFEAYDAEPPDLPRFDPSKVGPIPFRAELEEMIRQAEKDLPPEERDPISVEEIVPRALRLDLPPPSPADAPPPAAPLAAPPPARHPSHAPRWLLALRVLLAVALAGGLIVATVFFGA